MIYLDSSEFFCLKGGLNGSCLAKAGEFAATDLNNSDLISLLTLQAGHEYRELKSARIASQS